MRWLISMLIMLCTHAIISQESFTLVEAIAYAKSHSNDMALSVLDISTADAQLKEYKSIGLPQVNAGLDYNHYFYAPVSPVEDFITPAIYGVLTSEFPGEVTPPTGDPQIFEFGIFTKHNLSAKVDASMLVFDGSYLTGLKAAKLFKELTAKKVEIKEEDIAAKVTKAYMNILITEENKKTLNKNTTNIKQALKEAKAFYESGFMEQLDVDRILLSLESLSTEQEKLDQVIRLSYDLLRYQMNYPPDQELRLSEDFETIVKRLRVEAVTDHPEIDYTKRAEYAQIELGQELNMLNLERYKKGYLPSLRARAGVSEALQRNELFNDAEAGWLPTVYAGLSLNIPLIDGKFKKSKIQQAEIEIEKTEIQKQEFERGVALQAQNSYTQYLSANSILDRRQRTIDLVQGIYDKTLIKFKEGVGSSIEVTQAESQLFDAQSKYINALYDLLTSKIDLDIALGQLDQ